MVVPLSFAAAGEPTTALTTVTAQKESTPLNLDWAGVQGLNQPPLPEQTGVSVTYRVGDQEVNVTLPIDLDASLWKGATQPAKGPTLILRDGRYSQALLRVDVDRIPKEAEIIRATLHFRVQGVERKGDSGTFTCFRVLTPWTAAATWEKPAPPAVPWNGLQPGTDFTPDALGTTGPLDVGALQKNHQDAEIAGLEDAVRKWRDGEWPNHGLLVTFSGKALQAAMPSREAAAQTRSLVVGGATHAKVVLTPNFPLLKHDLLSADDLVAAQLSIFVEPIKTGDKAGSLSIFESDAANAPGKLLASVPLQNLTPGTNLLPDIGPTLRSWLASDGSPGNLLLGADGTTNGVTITGNTGPHRPILAASARNHQSLQLFGEPTVRLQPGVYAKVIDGHLTYDGQRLRLWGVVGHPTVDRLLKMGFNAERLWDPGSADCYTTESAKRGEIASHQQGDGSKLDEADKHFAELKAHGVFVMFAALTGTIPIEGAASDGSFIAGGADWAQWKEAATAKGTPLYQVLFVDDRLQQIRKRAAKNLLTHINPYTGKSYGEDEAIAFYEIFNENAFLERTLTSGTLAKWPPYFRQELQKRWNDWLVRRYATDDGVIKAWGSLKPGESAANGTVEPAPVFEARTGYPETRADDFIEFMIELENHFNDDFRSYCRSLFPAGVGVNVAGFSFDTFFRPNLPWAFQQSQGDIHCDGMYFWSIPSTLDKPPSAYVLDSFTPVGMPTVLYETNSARPSPYRTEYPIKLAAMASRQDWDGVFWHYWQRVSGPGDIAYLNNKMDYQHTTFYWTGVEHQTDPVMCSSMAIGGRIFLGGGVPPAQEPEVFKVGKKALFSYNNFRGINTAAATFTKGSRLLFDPKADSGITVNGQPPPQTGRIKKALASGQYVTWDWPNGRLIIDSPTVKAYVGKVNGSFAFADGIELRDVSTPWISFALVSADGHPLTGAGAATRAYMSGVFDARNSGFEFDYNARGGPVEQAAKISNYGHEPVVVDPVAYKVTFPLGLHGSLKSYDFALREIHSSAIDGGKQLSQGGATPFMDVLEVQSWDQQPAPIETGPTQIVKEDYAGLVSGVRGGGSTAETTAITGAIFPVSTVDWTMNLGDAHRALRDSPLVFTSISNDDNSRAAETQIVVTDAQLPLLWDSLADLQLDFKSDRMSRAEVTFKQPPSVEELIGLFRKTLGEPAQKKLDAQYGVTQIHWPARAKFPDVFVTESQGIMKIIYLPPVTR